MRAARIGIIAQELRLAELGSHGSRSTHWPARVLTAVGEPPCRRVVRAPRNRRRAVRDIVSIKIASRSSSEVMCPRKPQRNPSPGPMKSRKSRVRRPVASANARVLWNQWSSSKCCRAPAANSASGDAEPSANGVDALGPQSHAAVDDGKPVWQSGSSQEPRPVEKPDSVGKIIHRLLSLENAARMRPSCRSACQTGVVSHGCIVHNPSRAPQD